VGRHASGAGLVFSVMACYTCAMKTIRWILVIVSVSALAGCGKSADDGSGGSRSMVFAGDGGGAPAGFTALNISGYSGIEYYTPVALQPQGAGAAGEAAGITEAEDTPFTMVDCGPEGELPVEMKKPSIYAVFSAPAVPLAQLGAPLTEDAALFDIQPPLAGTYRWYGTRLIAFEPSEDLKPEHRYTVKLSARIHSLGGRALEGKPEFSFQTAQLSCLSWTLGDGSANYWVDTNDAPPAEAKQVTMIFSYPVDLNEIAKWLEVRVKGQGQNAQKTTIPFTLSRPATVVEKQARDWKRSHGPGVPEIKPEQVVLLTLKKAPPEDSEIEVALLAGARSEPGDIGTEKESVWSFHTLLPFNFYDIHARSVVLPRTKQGRDIPVYIDFTHPLDPKTSRSMFEVEGFPPIAADNFRVSGNTVTLLNLPFEYEKAYTVKISSNVKDIYGRALGKELEKTVRVGIADSYAFVPNQGVAMLEAAFPPKIAWESQNLSTLKFDMKPTTHPFDMYTGDLPTVDISGFPRNEKKYIIEDLSPLMGPGGKGSVAMAWEWSDPASSGFHNAALTVQVTDLGITCRYAANQALVWVTRLSTGAPVSGARVQLLNTDLLKRESLTNSAGLAVFDFKPGEFAGLFSPPTRSYPPKSRYPIYSGLCVRVLTGGGAAAGGDEAIFQPTDGHNTWRYGGYYGQTPFTLQSKPLLFMFTDRGLYRPGEQVSFRSIDRDLYIGNFTPYTGPVTLTVTPAGRGSVGNPIVTLSAEASDSGGSYGSFDLPDNLDPGTYNLTYYRAHQSIVAAAKTGGGRANNSIPSSSINFTVANFKRLRFQASISFPSGMDFFQGDMLPAQLTASYLAGGGMSGASYKASWISEAVPFNPGGRWSNWKMGPGNYGSRNYLDKSEGTLGPAGNAAVSIKAVAQSGIEGMPYQYRVEADVQDAARQEVAAVNTVLVHPASFYIAARLDEGTPKIDSVLASNWILSAGKNAAVSWALVTPEGKNAVADAGSAEAAKKNTPRELTAQLVRFDWKMSNQSGYGGYIYHRWDREETVIAEKKAPTSALAAGTGSFIFPVGESGQYEIRLRSKDNKDRPAFTRMGFYASGSGWMKWHLDNSDSLGLQPDQDSYSPGDTARILVQSPLPRGKYLLTIEREGILDERIIDLDGSARTIEIPVKEEWTPLVYVAIASFTTRSGPPGNTYFEPDLDRPKPLFGMTMLKIANDNRRYNIEIENDKAVYSPADNAEVTLRVTRQGKPAAGVELTFMAVDRAVIDLINYHVDDPLNFFYNPANFPLATSGGDSRVMLIDPVTYTVNDLQGGDSDSKLDERKDFRPLAVFEPCILSDKNGMAKVRFKLPDSLTIYRCTAVAAGKEDFGIKEKELPVSAPLTAVPALPLKLRWRDTGQVSLVVSNLDKKPVSVKVGLDVQNKDTDADKDAVLVIVDETEKETLVAAGTTVEFTFRVAAVGPGSASLTFTVNSPKVNERIIKSLTVDRPVVYETVTAMGNISRETPKTTKTNNSNVEFIEEGIAIPSLIPQGTGSVSLSMSASRMASLKDSVAYLLDYPYGCLEQRTARLLPILAMGDSLDALDLETPVKDIPKEIRGGLEQIAKSQLSSGAFPYWPGSADAWPDLLVSLRVAHIAALAAQKGYDMPAPFNKQRLLDWLVNGNISPRESVRGALSKDPFLHGYQLWVRSLLGERVGGEISDFLKEGDSLGISGWSFAGLAALECRQRDLASSTLRQVRKFIRPGTRSLDLTDTYDSKGNYWGSDADRYAIALMLFESLAPSDDMTTRISNALIEKQRRGVWENTEVCFWAIIAFGKTMDEEKKAPTDFIARASLGGVKLLEAPFKGAGGLPASGQWPLDGPPLATLPRDKILPLRIERDGKGRLFYSASLRYGIPAEIAAARDEGLSVYAETLDPDGNQVTDGHLIPGQTYTRRIFISTSRDRTFVALRAPVPSGADILDAQFVTTASAPPPQTPARSSYGTTGNYDDWFDYTPQPMQFIMDDEVRFHWEKFPAGQSQVDFRFRAVMPGVYPTPPASAECMYEPEVFGRSPGELIEIGSR